MNAAPATLYGQWNPVLLNGNYLIGGVDRLGFNPRAQVFLVAPSNLVSSTPFSMVVREVPCEFNRAYKRGSLFCLCRYSPPSSHPIGGKDKTGSMELIALIPFT